MLNRRHIRIKVLQLLYAFFHSESDDLMKLERELEKSFNKTYDLYIHMLALLLNLKSLAEQKIEKGKNKLLPSREDLDPNTKFIDNQVLNLLSKNLSLLEKIDSEPICWEDNKEIQTKLFRQILDSDLYDDYMTNSQSSFIDDRKFISALFAEFIAANEDLHSFLQENSIYWSDDFISVNLAVVKTIKSFKPDSDEYARMLPLFKSEDDKQYAFNLLKRTLANATDYKKYIVETASNWEEDRISDMDQLIMQMSICELLNFETIPVKVTLNEYIEVSKDYSSQKSKVFINGVIDKLVIRFKKEGKLKKIGRGLVE
ncbi:MAG: transcription antitermination factor NusB [Flavobacteriales bacterium]|nr:transcription antitermination factor NusB [Flavobacteriales bacterium]